MSAHDPITLLVASPLKKKNRRKSESANPSNMTAVRGRVPSPAKAVELQAEVSQVLAFVAL